MHRLLLIDMVCEAFHLGPTQAAQELEGDPDRRDRVLRLLELRGYKAAYQAWKRARNKVDDLKTWEGDPNMTLVELHTYELHQAQVAAAESESDPQGEHG